MCRAGGGGGVRREWAAVTMASRGTPGQALGVGGACGAPPPAGLSRESAKASAGAGTPVGLTLLEIDLFLAPAGTAQPHLCAGPVQPMPSGSLALGPSPSLKAPHPRLWPCLWLGVDLPAQQAPARQPSQLLGQLLSSLLLCDLTLTISGVQAQMTWAGG